MACKIKDIIYDDKSYSVNGKVGQKNVLPNLSKINIIVGENNSGKSRFVRNIFGTKVIKYLPTDFSLKQVNELILIFKTNVGKLGSINDNLRILLSNISEPKYLDDATDYVKAFYDLKEFLKQWIGNNSRVGWGNSSYTYGAYASDINGMIQQHLLYNGTAIEELLKKQTFYKVYIPIMRGIRALSTVSNDEDILKNIIINDHFKGQIDNGEVFSGLGIYKTLRSYLLGNLNQRKMIKDFEAYLSSYFFNNKGIALIPSEQTGILTIKIGDEQEQPIYNLGDGIQSLIIMTFPLFLHQGKNLLAFIEEPEQMLHPGLQRRFLETISDYPGFENYQFFLTTHSNHFLDITIDFKEISIYSLKKVFDQVESEEKLPQFIIEKLSQGDNSALSLLGVRNSSVFLSNCTIWVEGITDRYFVKHYLQLYQEKLKETNNHTEIREDIHYSFVEYGGNNITHYSFLDNGIDSINIDRLCSKLFLIVDKDKGKDKRHKKLHETLGERFFVLNRKEIENIIKKETLLKIVKEYEGIDPEQEFSCKDFEYKDYSDVYLGQFIEEKVLINKKRKGYYQAESGTISDKLSFCNKARKYIKNWDDVSIDAQKITKNIYDFIITMNIDKKK
jgi:hypothetical protein